MKLPYKFDSRLMADWAADGLINKMKDILDRYGTVTVADVFDIMQMTTLSKEFYSKFAYTKYGWTKEQDLNINVFRERSWSNSTYGINLSDPIFLE